MANKKDTVVVSWLMGGQSTPGFVSSITSLIAISPHLGVNLLGALPRVSGPRIAAARNDTVVNFLSTSADWLFMVDDDMTFEPDALAKLLEVADRKTHPIVGGYCYAAGRDGYFSTVWTLNESKMPVRVDEVPPSGVVQVAGTGAACLLVHRSVLEAIRESDYGKTPWPWFQESALNGHLVGEDFTFCARAQELGFPIFVHTEVEFGHQKLVTLNREFVDNWRRMNRVIITGSGRCGTAYMAHVLSVSGLACSHERVFHHDGPGVWEWQRFESSWMAAPFLEGFDGSVVHLVRDPLAVVNSLVGIGFFDENLEVHGVNVAEIHAPLREYARRFLDLPDDPVEAAMAYVVAWNRMVEPYADMRVRVEDADGETFQSIARLGGAHHGAPDFAAMLGRVPTNINSRRRAELTWDDMTDDVKKLAVDYGYRS